MAELEGKDVMRVTMLVSSGQGSDSQWFDYRPSFFTDIVRVEWDLDTMDVELPAHAADYLVRNGYAKPRVVEQEAPPTVVDPPPPKTEEATEKPSSTKKKEKSK